MTTTLIDDHASEIAALCRRFGVRRLDVFGSVVRDDFDPTRSDVDFLVEFEPEVVPSLGDYFDLRDELSCLLGRPVDLVMARVVRNPYIRAAIDSERRLGVCGVTRGRISSTCSRLQRRPSSSPRASSPTSGERT